MAFLIYIAVMALLVLAIAHSYLGERYILIRLFKRDNLPKLFGSDVFTKRTLRFVWHLTSIAWLCLAGILMVLAQPTIQPKPILLIISATFFIHCIAALFGSKGKHLSWILFALITLCTALTAIQYF